MSKKKKKSKKQDPTLGELLNPRAYQATSPGDRIVEILDREICHSHLDERQACELSWLLWEAHTGDDSCGCTRYALCNVLAGDELLALDGLRNCIAEHDSGAKLRAWNEKKISQALDGLG